MDGTATPLRDNGDGAVTARPQVVDGAGAPDPLAELEHALASLLDEDTRGEVEIYAVQGNGRGEGAREWLESIPLDCIESVSDLFRILRDDHGGGAFDLVVRRPGRVGHGGGYAMNRRVRVKRTRQPNQQQQPDVATLVAAAVEKIADKLAPKSDGLGDLEKLAKFRELGLLPKPSEPEKPKSLLEQIEEAQKLMKLMGGKGGDGEGPHWAVELVREFGPLLRDKFAGGDDDEDEDDGDDESAPASREEQVLEAVRGFAGHLQRAAEAGTKPADAATLALQMMRRPEALVRFCEDPKALAKLLKLAPELMDHADWLAQVRVAIVRQGAAKLPAPPQQIAAPPATPAAQQDNEGKAGADAAGADTGRKGGRGRNRAANAAGGEAGTAPANCPKPRTPARRRA